MSQSANEAIFRAFMDAINRYDYEAIAALCADDVMYSAPGKTPVGGTFRGKAALVEWLKSYDEGERAAFPEGTRTTITNVVEAGERLACEWVCEGRAADGRELSLGGATFVEIAGGKILSGRDYWDTAEILPYLA